MWNTRFKRFSSLHKSYCRIIRSSFNNWLIDIKTAKTGELKSKLGFNQLDTVMTKQE